MDLVTFARSLPGSHVTRATLTREGYSWRQIEAALADGRLVRLSTGLYSARPELAAHAASVAERLGGVLCGPSAAQALGWPLLVVPPRPWVAIHPKRRRVRAEDARLVYAHLDSPQEPLDCVLMSARLLPWPEALALADGALKRRAVTPDELLAAAASARGRGAARVRRVARHASPLAATVEESALRAHALDVGLDPVPQHEIPLGRFTVHPDLVDVARRIVIELDPWSLHGKEELRFDRDVERYTLLTAQGWRVVRYTQAHVRQRDFVVETLTALRAASR